MGLCIISAGDVERYRVSRGAVLVDLRSPQEYERWHIDGAVSVPSGRLAEYMRTASRTQIYIFYCQHGSLSFQEGKKYVREGYQICTLNGGAQAYRALGWQTSGNGFRR